MSYAAIIAKQLQIRPLQVEATIGLLDGGNTIPFIARYRKEMTGALDEDQLRQVGDLLQKFRTLDERRSSILNSLEEQGVLTDALRQAVMKADTLTSLEDIYQPYKPKRRTRATIAREQGLEPLALQILQQARLKQSPTEIAAQYINADVASVEDALAGARDIVAEAISDHPEVRGNVREKALKFGALQCSKVKDADDPKGVYATYYEFDYRIPRLKAYQVLAMNRGVAEKVLKLKLNVEERDWRTQIERIFPIDGHSSFAAQLELAIDDAAKRLLLPAIERDVHTALTEEAELHAIGVFSSNLRGLLNQPPVLEHVVLGLDPAYRTGCKVAVIDATGKVLETTTIYPHEPQRQRRESLASLQMLIKKHGVTLISIGNGTASRETEQLVAELTRNLTDVHYVMVNEAGASVYSASPLARQELPDLDVTLRGAVSIARRILDPLAELVKIDPKSIGVGLYQHDVNQKQLSVALDAVVETVVNRVGVDVNTASVALLQHVAGIGPKLAERIVAYRDENGKFLNRKALKEVPSLGPKAFEQAAGFLRVRDGDNLLDMSAIHPESYKIAEQVLKKAKLSLNSPHHERETALSSLRPALASLAEELHVGLPTLQDIFEQLARPGRDPREDLPRPILRSDVLSMDDLQVGMRLNGTVRNVVDFGAFIDIGVKQDGLLHRSQTPRGLVLSVGEIIEVEILNIEAERGRIGLAWPSDL